MSGNHGGLHLKNASSWLYPALIIVGLAAMLLHYGSEIARGGNEWKSGDWLINYSGGFVRRGLLGEILYRLSDSGQSLLWMLFGLQSMIYCGVFGIAYHIYRVQKLDSRWLLLLLSPAFLLFPYYDLQGGFRKEIISFLAYSVLCLSYSRGKFRMVVLVSAILIFMLGCASHEANALTLPFFLLILYLGYIYNMLSGHLAVIFAMLFVVTATTGFVVSALYPGNAAQELAVCNSLVEKGLGQAICNGSISWLDKTGAESIELVRNRFVDYLASYPLLFFLAILPVLLIGNISRVMKIWFLVGFVFLLPLYVLAVDWGRWIHIYIFFVFFTLLTIASSSKLRLYQPPIYLVVIYLSFWSVPHCSGGIKIGLAGKIITGLFPVLH